MSKIKRGSFQTTNGGLYQLNDMGQIIESMTFVECVLYIRKYLSTESKAYPKMFAQGWAVCGIGT